MDNRRTLSRYVPRVLKVLLEGTVDDWVERTERDPFHFLGLTEMHSSTGQANYNKQSVISRDRLCAHCVVRMILLQ